MKDISDCVPADLRARAFKAGSEMAWERGDALTAIRIASELGWAAVAVEIWLASARGPEIPQPFYYGWEMPERKQDEDWSTFASRANSNAAEYVRRFEWDEADSGYRGREPLFNLDVIPPERLSDAGLQ